jgi:hypothetical protein
MPDIYQPADDLELIMILGERWKKMREKYPDPDPDEKKKTFEERARGWRPLALGLAIAALVEEHYGVNHFNEILRRKDTP